MIRRSPALAIAAAVAIGSAVVAPAAHADPESALVAKILLRDVEEAVAS